MFKPIAKGFLAGKIGLYGLKKLLEELMLFLLYLQCPTQTC